MVGRELNLALSLEFIWRSRTRTNTNFGYREILGEALSTFCNTLTIPSLKRFIIVNGHYTMAKGKRKVPRLKMSHTTKDNAQYKFTWVFQLPTAVK